MILIDTSVWIDHLRKADNLVSSLLAQGEILSHPMVIGEIAVGSFRNREEILSQLNGLQIVRSATHDEALQFISYHKLFGTGIGYIDVHLLASVRLTPAVKLWTRDKRLDCVAEALGLRYAPVP
jgi:predicted nucleic acid-binding protein